MKPIALVTGAGARIGKMIALELAADGYKVMAADIDRAAVRETARLVAARGGDATAFELDVSVDSDVAELAATIHSQHGPLDALVNNAAIQVNASVEGTSYVEFRRKIDVNIGAVFLCSKYFMPQLRLTKGAIVNISSVNAFFAERGCAVYCATKAAIVGMTKAMAIDHGRDGIRVNCVCPGYIDAGLASGYFESQPDPRRHVRPRAGCMPWAGSARLRRSPASCGSSRALLRPSSPVPRSSLMAVSPPACRATVREAEVSKTTLLPGDVM